ncbi:DUF2637 domain-containing protein [Actinomadura sp. NPDC048955]|uniref:DUF2637 domain-containing protein n=1 Tax=Actinomadura sp. NPDC048955 TaxID=3158228 RepID=UPI0033C6E1E9
MTDRLIRITTALAVVAVATVAAVISYRHAYELVHSHGETGPTARLVPFTVDGLIWAASMVILDASRRKHPAPPLAKWSLAVGIVATVGANVAHGTTPDLVDTGFHPLDGARYLRDTHLVDNHLFRLVAHHSCALVEARERGVDRTLTAEFSAIAPQLSDSLLFCAMTTSPDGTQLTAKERLKEILDRYGTGHLVSRAIRISSTHIINTVEQIEETLHGKSPR